MKEKPIYAHCTVSAPKPSMVTHPELIEEARAQLSALNFDLDQLSLVIKYKKDETTVERMAVEAVKRYAKVHARMLLIFNNEELVEMLNNETVAEMMGVLDGIYGKEN